MTVHKTSTSSETTIKVIHHVELITGEVHHVEFMRQEERQQIQEVFTRHPQGS